MIRSCREPKSTSTAVSSSTRMTRPRPYRSWVTWSCTSNTSTGAAAGGALKGLLGRWRRGMARAGFITTSMRPTGWSPHACRPAGIQYRRVAGLLGGRRAYGPVKSTRLDTSSMRCSRDLAVLGDRATQVPARCVGTDPDGALVDCLAAPAAHPVRVEVVVTVPESGRRLRRHPAIAPGQQCPEYRGKIPSRRSQVVVPARRGRLVLAALQDPGLDEGTEPGGQAVARRARIARDLIEPVIAEGDLADCEERPLLAQQVQGPGDRARPARKLRSGKLAGFVPSGRGAGDGHPPRLPYQTVARYHHCMPVGVSNPKYARAPFVVVLAAIFMTNLDLFIVNVALPSIGKDFGGSSLAGLSWVLNAYAISFAALLVAAGRLGDRIGQRRVFLAGMALFTVASAACAAAPDLALLVAARAIQAAGAAALIPTSLALLLAATAPERRSGRVRAWAAVGGISAALGPVAGGLLVQADWRWVFP